MLRSILVFIWFGLVACNAHVIDATLAPTVEQPYRAQPDVLTADYLKAEQTLWGRLNNEKENRPNLLPEIYEQHKFSLARDFGETGVIWELGIRLHEQIINSILAINGTASSLQAALEHKHYDGALATAQSVVEQTVKAADTLAQLSTQTSFWNHISTNVSLIAKDVLLTKCNVWFCVFAFMYRYHMPFARKQQP